MTRRDNSALRCAGCRLHRTLCACAFIPRIETRTRVLLFIHHFEDRKSTNTGRLATRCLVNSELVVRGRESEPTEAFASDPSTQALLLFPHPAALPLQRFVGSERPITLVVPLGLGGSTDVIARIMAEGMRNVLGATIVVENTTGAVRELGAIATDFKDFATGLEIVVRNSSAMNSRSARCRSRPSGRPTCTRSS